MNIFVISVPINFLIKPISTKQKYIINARIPKLLQKNFTFVLHRV